MNLTQIEHEFYAENQNRALRDAIYSALQNGATPAELRRRYPMTRGLTCCEVHYHIEQWEKSRKSAERKLAEES